MRLKRPHPFLCICFFVQVTLAYPKNNDYLKDGQRTNPKKYSPTSLVTSTSRPAETNVRLRHSSKFSHFDHNRNRIAGSNSSASSNLFSGKSRYSDNNRYLNSDSRWKTSDHYHRLRHHGWSNRVRTTTTTTTTPNPDDDLFNNYGELDGGLEMEDDYHAIFGETNDDDDDYMENGFQAEAPSSTERSTPAPPKFSNMNDYKWKTLGTREKVEETRRNWMQQKDSNSKKRSEEIKSSAAIDHYIRVINSGECKKPIPKVIPVHVEHPDSSVTYIPHCTVLHRCAEDTGCCKDDTTCQYKERVEVTLYFYVKQIGSAVVKVEKLSFFNHTECECRGKTQEDQANTTERQKRVADIGYSEPNPKSLTGNSLGQGYTKSRKSNVPENLLQRCKCPKEFVPKIYNSKCFCDCRESNEDCMRMKKGKEYNSLADRLCIQRRECGTVSCEYGPYNKLKGRCPKYEES